MVKMTAWDKIFYNMNLSECSRWNLFLFLLILALFVGGSMGFYHGSSYVGALFFVLMFILMLNLKSKGSATKLNIHLNSVHTPTGAAEIMKNNDYEV